MNELLRSAVRIVALFPHEDAARPLRLYKGRLLAAGFLGARAFPLCAPLATLLRPLNKEELKTMAEEIRASAKLADEHGRISMGKSKVFNSNDQPLPPYLGFPLSFSAPRSLPQDALLSVSAHPALVLAILETGIQDVANFSPTPAQDSPAFFRAAYLANLVIAPAESGDPRFSYLWEIGRPRWLPGYER